ncbi:MAG: ATP-binding cassette domain-containing protein [Akkermansia sp.]
MPILYELLLLMLKADHITYEIDANGESLKLLRDINFEIPHGHFMAIVGTSGCGKTTLLKAIAGMIEETEGAFFWDGQNLAEQDFDPSEIGYVPQFSIAYEQLSVDENLESAARIRSKFADLSAVDERIDFVLDETGMDDIAERKVKILSGGQKRRLSLAMELVSNPTLLLCDEVTSGLDPQSEKEIVKLLHNLSRKDGRIVISVTHSLAHLDKYDSILVLHQGCIAFHGNPRALAHYFDVESLEDIYPKLAERSGEKWAHSWEKHKNLYYEKMSCERKALMAKGLLTLPENLSKAPSGGQSANPSTESSSPPEEVTSTQFVDREIKESQVPNPFSQFLTILGRRWKIFFRDRTQLTLQILMILLFPIMVALFSSKGQEPINKLSATRDQNIITEIQQQQTVQQNNVKVGSAVSGIIMFEVVLLGLMGSNNAAREIAGERLLLEKEKYGGLHTSSYLLSKLVFLSTLVLIQSFWMYAFVDFFWPFRGDGFTHLSFLVLANAAMTSVCLAISALSRSADQASLLSIYLVGFQLPLSGAVLALPEQIEMCVRPFISAYWSWSGSISGLDNYVYNAVKIVIDTSLSSANMCYAILGIHIIVGIVGTYIGIKRPQWD